MKTCTQPKNSTSWNYMISWVIIIRNSLRLNRCSNQISKPFKRIWNGSKGSRRIPLRTISRKMKTNNEDSQQGNWTYNSQVLMCLRRSLMTIWFKSFKPKIFKRRLLTLKRKRKCQSKDLQKHQGSIKSQLHLDQFSFKMCKLLHFQEKNSQKRSTIQVLSIFQRK